MEESFVHVDGFTVRSQSFLKTHMFKTLMSEAVTFEKSKKSLAVLE